MNEARKNPGETWSREGLSNNKGITLKDVKGLVLPNATSVWAWHYISENISIDQVRENPNETWSRSWLSMNKDINTRHVCGLVLPNATGSWNWYNLSQRIPIYDIYIYPDIIDKKGLSSNPRLEVRDIYALDQTHRKDWRKVHTALSDIDIVTH